MSETPSEDEQREDLEHSHPYELPQWLNEKANPRRPRRIYYSDEHPETPKVKRASLPRKPYQNPERSSPPYPEVQPLKPARSRVERANENTKQDLRSRPAQSHEDMKQPASSRLARAHEDSKQDARSRLAQAHEDAAWDEPSKQEQTSHTMATQRRRPIVYEPHAPSPRHPYTSEKRQNRKAQHQLNAFPLAFRQLRQKPALLTIGGVALGLLIITLLISTVAHSLQPQATSNTTTGATNTNAAVSSLDPHELVITPPDTDHPAPALYATAAYLLDADSGATLYARNPFLHLPMLSTTKLMTALIVAEQGNLDQRVTITDAMANDLTHLSPESSLMNIKKGETYTVRDLLYGMLLVSGNDAALVLADQSAGSEPKFAQKMNQRAALLGLQDTHYVNSHGLPATGHFSSARDLAILAKVSLSQPIVHQISSTRTYHIDANGDHPEHTMYNGDQFLWWYPGVDGGKPGWDGGANFVQIVSCVRNNRHLIGILIHTRDWWTDMRDLMNWGFSQYTWYSPRDTFLNNGYIPYAADWGYFTRDKKENTVPTADRGRYYIYTGYSISGLIKDYFDKSGGLNTFGYPQGQASISATNIISQHFDQGTIQCDGKTKQCKKT